MGIFAKWSKKAVETVKEQAEEIASQSASEKIDIVADFCKIGTFVGILFLGVRELREDRKQNSHQSGYSTMTTNNYYFYDGIGKRFDDGRKKNDH